MNSLKRFTSNTEAVINGTFFILGYLIGRTYVYGKMFLQAAVILTMVLGGLAMVYSILF